MRPTPLNTPLIATTLPAAVRLPDGFETTRPPSNRSLPLVGPAPADEEAVMSMTPTTRRQLSVALARRPIRLPSFYTAPQHYGRTPAYSRNRPDTTRNGER